MRRIIGGLAILAVLGGLAALPVQADRDDVMYYRGYFSAKAVEVPWQGMVYQVDPGTIQPAFYYRYGTRPLAPPPQRGYGGPGAGCPGGPVTAPLRQPGPTVLVTPRPLPGQYWYSEPGVYAFHTTDLGWPYDDRR